MREVSKRSRKEKVRDYHDLTTPTAMLQSSAANSKFESSREQRRDVKVEIQKQDLFSPTRSTFSTVIDEGGFVVPTPRPPKILRPSGLTVNVEEEAGDLLGGMLHTPLTLKWPAASSAELHHAIRDGNLSLIREHLSGIEIGDEVINRAVGEEGFTPLIFAACLSEKEFKGCGPETCRLLLEKKADVTKRDGKGLTCLHWAALSGNPESTSILAKTSIRDFATNRDIEIGGGAETAMHFAARAGGVGCVRALLDAGADFKARNGLYETPLDLAGVQISGRVMAAKRTAVRKELLIKRPELKTLILQHEECLQHMNTNLEHQESPLRIRFIDYKIKNPRFFSDFELCHSNKFPPATFSEVLRAHSKTYVSCVQNLAISINDGPVAFTPRVQRGVHQTPDDFLKDDSRCDTSFSKGSLSAALHGAGAAIHAVDRVMRGDNRNAFCLIRPPGHHAGRDGLLHDCVSCGFCIFNSVAIAALHALEIYGEVDPPPPAAMTAAALPQTSPLGPHPHPSPPSTSSTPPLSLPGGAAAENTIGVTPTNLPPITRRPQRIAIVDFDAHHGNGTEHIIKYINKPDRLFFFSIHVFLKVPGFEFYPGSGEKDSMIHNIINVPIPPLWANKLNLSATSAAPAVAPPKPHEKNHGQRGRKKKLQNSAHVSPAKSSKSPASSNSAARAIDLTAKDGSPPSEETSAAEMMETEIEAATGVGDFHETRIASDVEMPDAVPTENPVENPTENSVTFVGGSGEESLSTIPLSQFENSTDASLSITAACPLSLGADERPSLPLTDTPITNPLPASDPNQEMSDAQEKGKSAKAETKTKKRGKTTTKSRGGAGIASTETIGTLPPPDTDSTPVTPTVSVAATAPPAQIQEPEGPIVIDNATASVSVSPAKLSSVSSAAGHPPAESGRIEFRKAVASRLIPALRAFNPTLIIVSAGFDGGKGDLGNVNNYGDLTDAGLDLAPVDFEWIMQQIGQVANVCCDGRVVSVLEGGYGHYEKSAHSVDVINRSSLAENVSSHLRGLVGTR